MGENYNSNKGMLPQTPNTGSFLAFWSVLLGGLGLLTDCLPLFSIWNLPAGLIFGLTGIALAILSKKGSPSATRHSLD